MPLKLDKLIEEKLSKKMPHDHEVDDYLKWTPFTSIFILDLLGVRSKHSWKKHFLLFACCETMLSIVSNSLKKLVHEHRPEPTLRKDSFPSGHADTAFAGAEIIRTELKDEHPVLAYSGYAVAAAVSTMRLYKDKHWLSDLVAGAVLGIICTRLTYLICKGHEKKPAEMKRDEILISQADGQTAMGFAL